MAFPMSNMGKVGQSVVGSLIPFRGGRARGDRRRPDNDRLVRAAYTAGNGAGAPF